MLICSMSPDETSAQPRRGLYHGQHSPSPNSISTYISRTSRRILHFLRSTIYITVIPSLTQARRMTQGRSEKTVVENPV